MGETVLGDTISETEGKAAYDAAVKRLLANKTILAHILKGCVPEYRDCSLSDIEYRYIEGDPNIGDIQVDRFTPNANIRGMNTEDKTDTEGTQYFDIRFYASLPDSDERIGLIINVEAQNDYYPGYALVRRGIYYCCRLISAQYGVDFSGKHYEKLKKVYSIWVCPNAPLSRSDTITKYRITEECVKGESTEDPKNYDLLNVIMINFNDDDHADGLNRFLKVLLSNTYTGREKHRILTDEFNVKFTNDLKGEMDSMCNLSDGIEAKGIAKGMKKGMAQGMEQGMAQGMEQGMARKCEEMVRLLLLDATLSEEKIAAIAGISAEEVRRIRTEITENK